MSILKHVITGNEQELRHLLDAGADPNEREPGGSNVTALLFVAMRGDTISARQLLQAGADVNARDSQGMTALMHAVVKGHTECVEALIEAGADVTIALNDGLTVSNFAANSSPEIKDTIARAVGAFNDKEASNGHLFVGTVTMLAVFRAGDLHIELNDVTGSNVAFSISGPRANGLSNKAVRLEFDEARCAPDHGALQELADCWVRIQGHLTEVIQGGTWTEASWQSLSLPIVLTDLQVWLKDHLTNSHLRAAFGTLQ